MNIREISKPVTAASLNESLAKRFGQRINLGKFTIEQLQDVRNKVRTTLSQVETNESFNSVQKEAYQKSKLFLDVLNAEISERGDIDEAAKPDFLDVDKDGDKKEPMKKAAKDAGKGKKGGKPKKGVVPPQFKKKNESIDEAGADLTDKELVHAVFKAIDLANSLDVDYAVDKVGEFAEDLYSAVNGTNESVCSECNKPRFVAMPESIQKQYSTVNEEKQKGVDGKVCWKGYKRMGTKKKGGKTVDNCVKM
jgi:hypothetical protein